MTVTLAAVQSALAAVAVPGIKRIYTAADVPNEMFSRLCPALIPHPDTPLTESASAVKTLGTLAGGQRGWVRQRTVAWVCLTAEVGQARGAKTHGELTSAVIDALENALCDFTVDGMHASGPVQLTGRFPCNDPSGKLFFGFDVRLSFVTSY